MELTIKKKIGRENYTFIVSGKNLHELVMESQKLSFPNVEKCGLCESDLLFLTARVAKNKFSYVDIKCAKCKGSLTFGRTQEDPDTFYLRKTEDKKFDWKSYSPEISE